MEVEFFTDSSYYTGPVLTDDMVRQAEMSLGVSLPYSYISLLRERNGGVPRNQCFPTDFPTSWDVDHFCIDAILGVGEYTWGIDSDQLGSRYLIEEWNYPNIGVIFCSTSSFEHDTVMFDYSQCGESGEPPVVYIDRDRVPRKVAHSFRGFVDSLLPCAQFDDD